MSGVKIKGNIKYYIGKINIYKNSGTWSRWHINKNILEKFPE